MAKKILGVLTGLWCLAGIILTIATPTQSSKLQFIVLAVVSGVACFLLLFRPAKRTITRESQKVENNNNFQMPRETASELKTMFYPEMVNNCIRIIMESFQIMQNTKNIDTLCNRYEVGLQNCYTLKELEQAGLYKGKPTSDYYISLYITNRFPLIQECYYKFLDEVKTETGKNNRSEKFWNTLTSLVDEFTLNDIKEFINQ